MALLVIGANAGSGSLVLTIVLVWLQVVVDKPPANCTANVITWHDIPLTTTNKPAAAAGQPSLDLINILE